MSAPLRALACLALGLFAAQVAPAADPVPALAVPRQGALQNGLSYFILPHTTEPGRISLHLLVHAGSLDERDGELGYAHFVEHMAFKGTRHYPPGELIRFFQKTGLAWGPDANANTSFTFTDYRLDLPARHAAHLTEALQILRDFADGITFLPAEVRRERGVVVSEIRERLTSNYQLEIQGIAALYRSTSLPARLPIGDPAQITRATAAGLRAFYDRCYQAPRLTVVAVGDVDPDAVQALIAANFGTLPAPAAPLPPADPGAPPADGLFAHILTNPIGTAAVTSLLAVTPRVPDTAAGRELDRLQQIVTRALNRRQRDLRAQSPDRFGLIQAQRLPGIDDRFTVHSLEGHTAAEDWAAGVAELERELRRARTDGFSAAELAEAQAAFLADVRKFRDTLQGAPPNLVAQHVVNLLAAGATWHDPALLLAEAQATTASLTPVAAGEALDTMFPEAGLRLLINTPQPPAGGVGTVLDAYEAAAARPLAAEIPAETAPLVFHYTDFGPAGAIASQRTAADLGIDLVTFANGVRLNLRASPTEPNRFRLVARIGRGLADLPRDRPGWFLISSSLLGRCDFNRQPREELSRIIRLRGVTARITDTGNQLLLSLEGPAPELPFAFQFLTAFLSDVKLEPARLTQALSDYAGYINPVLGSVEGYARSEFNFQMHNKDLRVAFATPGQVAGYPFPAIAAWIREHWLDGPLEVGLAGDIDPAAAVSAAAATLGTLGPRRDPPVTPDERLALPVKPRRAIIQHHGANDQAAVVYFGWPAPVADTRESRALRFATDALIDRLRLQLREQRGATYAPTGSVDRSPVQPDYAYAWLRLAFAPAQSAKLSALVNHVADDLARHGLTADEFARLGAPLRAQAGEDLRSNTWWLLQVLLYAQTRPGVLDDARTHAQAYADLTLADVNRAAAWLRLANASGIGASPARGKK